MDGHLTSIFLQSFGILLREGVEALLICTALAAAATKAGATRSARGIWWGAGVAIAASLVTAIVVEGVFHLSEASHEAIEGVTMLLAAVVLFYVSYWLLSKLEVARWMGYLRDRVAVDDHRWGVTGVAFLAVYREGAETVLFYRALWGVGDAAPIWGGIAAGAVVLALLGTAVLRYGVQLPIKPLFAITGALLYYLAFMFAGSGVHELQEAGWISETPVAGFPRIDLLGVYPTIETLVAQGLLVILALIALGVALVRRPDPR